MNRPVFADHVQDMMRVILISSIKYQFKKHEKLAWHSHADGAEFQNLCNVQSIKFVPRCIDSSPEDVQIENLISSGLQTSSSKIETVIKGLVGITTSKMPTLK